MGLVLKHVKATEAGTLHYRRKIPKDLRQAVGKGEFKRLLGTTAREALLAYPRVNAEFERLLAVARMPMAVPKVAAREHTTALDAFHAAASKYAEIAASFSTGDVEADSALRDAAAEGLLGRYPVDGETGEPVGVLESERLYINAIRAGAVKRPNPTIEDAKDLYIKDKIIGDLNETARRSRIERVTGILTASLGVNRQLASLERWDARAVKESMLRDMGIKPSTVRRYMNDIRAMITHGIAECGLRGVVNPFVRLSVAVDTVASEDRKPMSSAQIKSVRERLTIHASADLQRIWRLLENTGCRLGEVTGPLVADVFVDHPEPYLNLVYHQHRRLKNRGSIRRVPLIGDALSAMKEALAVVGDSIFLFPAYGRVRGADAASAALMKHVREVTDDPKVVVHSLRHSMEDRLSDAGVDDFDRNLVLGHSRGNMAERYGGPDAKLRAATAALMKVVEGMPKRRKR